MRAGMLVWLTHIWSKKRTNCNSSLLQFVVGWQTFQGHVITSSKSRNICCITIAACTWRQAAHDVTGTQRAGDRWTFLPHRPMPQWSGPDRWFDQKAHHRSKAPSPSRPSPYPRCTNAHEIYLSGCGMPCSGFCCIWNPVAFDFCYTWKLNKSRNSSWKLKGTVGTEYKDQNPEICQVMLDHVGSCWIMLDPISRVATPLILPRFPCLKRFVEFDDVGVVLPLGPKLGTAWARFWWI